MARKKIAKADEELDKLATELTLDQIHYQSDAGLLECLGRIGNTQSRRPF